MDPLLIPDDPAALALGARPKARRLNVSFQRLGGKSAYVLENPGSSSVYRVGEAEFRFLEALDGTRSIGEILAGQKEFDPVSALRFLEMLRGEGLLDEPGIPAGGVRPPPLLDRIGGLLFWRISFGDPDAFFIWLSRWFGWAAHPAAWLAGTGLIVLGVMTLARHSDRMRDATLGVLAPQNWLWIGLIFVVLRVIHEVWHGLTCRRLGGRVRDIGVMLILFIPLGYTDVTSCWTMPSRLHRFLVSAAGIFIELVLAAAAALVWAETGPGLVNTLAWQVVLTAGAASLLANANPLMRFDGYYIMMDVLDLPNLYTRGQIVVRAFVRRFLLGRRDQPLPPLRERLWRAAALYGPAALVWRLFVMANLLAAAGALFRGAGIAFVCVILLAWSRRVIVQSIGGFRSMTWGAQLGAAVRCLVLAGIVGALALVPWRTAPVEPALVDWADRCDVYAGGPGILTAAPVRPGTAVEAGTEVARMENPDLQAAADRLRLRKEKEALRTRLALREGDLPSHAAALAAEAAIGDELKHAEEKAARRVVLAPAAGMVYHHRLDQRLGQQIREGEPLLTIGHPVDREAAVLVPHDRQALYGFTPGESVEIWVPGRSRSWTGTIATISPAARRQIDLPALTSLGGGHLSVRVGVDGGKDSYELHDPQFEVRVRLAGPEATVLKAGERGYLRARGGPSLPVGRRAWGGLERFWSELLSRRT